MTTIFSLLLLAAAPAFGGESAAPGLEQYVSDGNFFTASVPVSWEKSEEILLGRQEKEYGVDMSAPGGPPAPAAISILYYAPDHAMFKTHEKFLNTQLKPPTRIKGEVTGKVKDVLVNHRRARTFDKRTFDFIPPYSPTPKKIEMFERCVVMPAKKGFYVLNFRTKKGDEKAYLPVFDKVLQSFKPNVK